MKKTITTLTLVALLSSNQTLRAQDLTSINVGATLPTFTFNSSTNELTVQMSVRNVGFFNSSPFDVALFIKNVSTNTEYEIDRVNQSGLSYNQLNNANTLQITGWSVDLDSKSQVPGGTYRVIARINDNQNATETNYTNNTENFGSVSFAYSSSAVGVPETTKDEYFSLFPSISNGKVTVKWVNYPTLGIGHRIEVFNSLGKMVDLFSTQAESYEKELNFTESEKGIYFIKVFHGEKSVVKRVVIY